MKLLDKLTQQVRQMVRLDEPPHRIAFAFAVGVFITVLPFFGSRTVVALGVAALTGLNVIPVLAGAWLNLPFTTPFVCYLCYLAGNWTLELLALSASGPVGGPDEATVKEAFSSWSAFFGLFTAERIWRILLPTVVGSVWLGLLASAVAYLSLRWVLRLRRRDSDCPVGEAASSG